MRLLLDTQIAFWWHKGDRSLSMEARRLVESADDSVFVSRASLWELAIKVSTGKLRVDLPDFILQTEHYGFEWLSIRTEHLLRVATLPLPGTHKDPFDRLLVAQALSEPLVLLTSDSQLRQYGDFVRVV